MRDGELAGEDALGPAQEAERGERDVIRRVAVEAGFKNGVQWLSHSGFLIPFYNAWALFLLRCPAAIAVH
jgi:hypothetical protein